MTAKKKRKPREIWERLDKESDTEWEYFRCYRDMSHRRQTKVAAAMAKSKDAIHKCAKRHDWAERTFEYDLHMDRIAVEAKETDLQKMHLRHLQISGSIQELAKIEINKLLVGANYDSLPTVKVSELAGLLKHGTELERLTRDQPSEITQSADYSKLAVDELKALQRLVKKAGSK